MKDKPYQQRFFADDKITSTNEIDTEFLRITSNIRKEMIFNGGMTITRVILDHKMSHKSDKHELNQCEQTGFLFRQWNLYQMIHQKTLNDFMENLSNDEDNS